MPNRLAHETSPYLLQHQDNPVDWYPWGDEAIEKARREEKPIFLSIGYSACHWCHVMEHESFENDAIAKLLNEDFVSIKVDREERPDLDQIYMNAVQMLTGRGGWPMSVFLTPELKPFYGGTYWPPQQLARHAGLRPDPGGRRRCLEESPRAGARPPPTNSRPSCKTSAPSATPAMSDAFAVELIEGGRDAAASRIRPHLRRLRPSAEISAPDGFAAAARRRRTNARQRPRRYGAAHARPHGGRRHLRSSRRRLLLATRSTRAGWCRISKRCCTTTPSWPAPISMPISSPAMPNYARVVRETLDYVLRDMTDPAGGFYSTEDADSEGDEGLFYTWTPDEIEAVLGEERGSTFGRIYDVSDAGNFEGRNILNLPKTLEQCASLLKRDAGGPRRGIGDSRKRNCSPPAISACDQAATTK